MLTSGLCAQSVRLVENSTAGVFRVLRADGSWSIEGAPWNMVGLVGEHSSLQPLVEVTTAASAADGTTHTTALVVSYREPDSSFFLLT